MDVAFYQMLFQQVQPVTEPTSLSLLHWQGSLPLAPPGELGQGDHVGLIMPADAGSGREPFMVRRAGKT